MRLIGNDSVNHSRNDSGAIPGGNGMEWNGGGREERNCSYIGNWRHPERPQMDGSLRDQSAGV